MVQPGKNEDVKRSETDFLGHVRTRASVVQIAPIGPPTACAATKNVVAQRSKRHRDPNDARSRAVEGVIAAHQRM